MREIQKGDRVKYRREWLRSVGAFTGEIPFRRGTVTEEGPGPLVQVDWGQGVHGTVNRHNLTHESNSEVV